MKNRLNTEVPTEGAVYLIQGMLCRAGIPTFKAPAFRAVYDLVAINPYTKKTVTIQVKSRFQTDCDRGFVVNRLGADFFAFVFLNMGNWYSSKPDEGIDEPEFYIVPKTKVEQIIDTSKKVPKFFVKKGDAEFKRFRDAWQLVAEALDIYIETILRGTE